MTDLNKQELRRLAEMASPAIEWYVPGDLRYADDKTGEVHGLDHDDDSFIAAAGPATILSLLDELEEAQSGLKHSHAIRLKKTIETLEAERDRWKEACQHMIDQTTPLEPVPGDPMWSRRIQLDEVIAERDQLRAEVATFEEGMRSMAFQLSAGGYNAPELSAKQLVDKVSWGINNFTDATGGLVDSLRAEVEALRKDAELLPLFTCAGKGGEYAKLGYARPAGAIKTIQGDSGLIVYRDTKTGQLYFRDPRDFEQRMMALAIMEPSPLGGDEVRELTTLDISTGAGKSCGGLGCCQLCADEKAGEGNANGQG